MEVAATISNRLFIFSVELRMEDSSSVPQWAFLLPALLASLLQVMVIRPVVITMPRWTGLLVLKLADTCPSFRISAFDDPPWLQVLSKVMAEVAHILLSEQTSLWALYLLAPHLFDIKFKLKVEVGMLRVILCLLLKCMERLLLRLVAGLCSFMEKVS